jgi:hypothetical protein
LKGRCATNSPIDGPKIQASVEVADRYASAAVEAVLELFAAEDEEEEEEEDDDEEECFEESGVGGAGATASIVVATHCVCFTRPTRTRDAKTITTG